MNYKAPIKCSLERNGNPIHKKGLTKVSIKTPTTGFQEKASTQASHPAPPWEAWRWLSLWNLFDFFLPLSLQTRQPCRESKSFISKSKIFIVHILKAKVLHHGALPRRGQVSQRRWLRWGCARQNRRQLICANGILPRGREDSLQTTDKPAHNGHH